MRTSQDIVKRWSEDLEAIAYCSELEQAKHIAREALEWLTEEPLDGKETRKQRLTRIGREVRLKMGGGDEG